MTLFWCLAIGVAAGVAWQAADLRRLHAQAEAAWQDLEALSIVQAPEAAQAVARYYADAAYRYHRRRAQIPVRWLAPWLGCAPRADAPPSAPAPYAPGPWG